MTLLFLDQRSQLAILLAAAVTQVAAPGCGGRPGPGGPAGDGGTDVLIVDPQPPDAHVDYHVADPMPLDAQVDHVDDPMPVDAQVDYHVSDPLPGDGLYEHATPHLGDIDPPPPLRAIPAERDLAEAAARAARADDLPLSRALVVRIARFPAADGAVRLRAVPSYPSPRLSFVWTASAGTLSSTTAGEVVWTAPPEPGRSLVQVVVRDGERALAVDAVVEVR